MTDNKIAEIRQRAENGLMDVAGQISRGDNSLALIKSRQVMEQIVRGYAKNFNIEYTDLAGTIENLYLANAVSNEDRESLHEIRLLGNKAVQEGYDDAQDAEKSYYKLKHEIELYLSYLVRQEYEEEQAALRREAGKVASVAAEKTSEAGVRETAGVQNKPSSVGAASIQGSPLRKRENEELDMAASILREKREGQRSQSVQRNSGNSQQRHQSSKNNRKNSQGSRNNAKSQRPQKAANDQRGGQHRGSRTQQSGFNIVDMLKILIPIICIILLIILIRSIIPNKPKESETQTTPVVTEIQTTETAEPETPAPEPETEAPVVRYKIGGDAVNVRYADNQDRIYEQLSKGTEIGEIEEIEGSDFVKFERDGIKLVVNKNYITPIEE